jgi:hypothetical protein
MKEDSRSEPAHAPMDAPYEAPQVERVIDSDEIGREVQYAGGAVPVSEFQ